MKNLVFAAIVLGTAVFRITAEVSAGDWLTAPSFYTHDPATGARTNQYQAPPEATVPQSPSYQSSGYSNYRSTLQFGNSADNYHRVEQWGPPVRPYGEWRFPNRPYAVPYDQWGPPFGGLNLGLGFGFGGFGGNHPGGAGLPGGRPGFPGAALPGQFPPGNFSPLNPYPSGPGQAYPVPPFADGFYPDYPVEPRLNDREFFRDPRQPLRQQPRQDR